MSEHKLYINLLNPLGISALKLRKILSVNLLKESYTPLALFFSIHICSKPHLPEILQQKFNGFFVNRLSYNDLFCSFCACFLPHFS